MKLTAESTVINDDKLNTDISSAKSVADNTAQYFWFTSSGNDTGAHISEKTQAQFVASPTGSNLLARSNGIAIRDGLQELATFTPSGVNMFNGGIPVAKFGQTIELYDGTRIIYEVKASASGAVKLTKEYNISRSNYKDYSDVIALGRTVSSWTSIIMKYKINGTASTKTYTSMPIYDNGGMYVFSASISGTDVTIEWYPGMSATASDVITLVSVEFNYTTTQQVVESTLGAYADKTESSPFRVGNGTADNAKSNAMLVDWAGNAKFNGDVIAYCDGDSRGGVSLAKTETLRYAFLYENSSGSVQIDMFRAGKAVMLYIYFSKSTSTSSGSDLFNVNLSGALFPEPATGPSTGGGSISGMTYYGAHAIGFLIEPDPSVVTPTDTMSYYHLVVRNASNSAVTASGVGAGTLMYISK